MTQLRSKCRISGNDDLKKVIDLGVQKYCGHFPSSEQESVPEGSLCLGWSQSSRLLQLYTELDIEPMYSDNYGYRSGLNKEMVAHLKSKNIKINNLVQLEDNDIAVDIGSNDGTFLGFYSENIQRVGIDPTISKFNKYYEDNIVQVPSFFDEKSFKNIGIGDKAKAISSISMFYDLPDPGKFVGDIKNILHKDGVWMFEQSYLPQMLATNSYDTICQEHIEYYSLTVINQLLKDNGLKIADLSLNKVNGGSIEVCAVHQDKSASNPILTDFLLMQEERLRLHTIDPYLAFAEKAKIHKKELTYLIRSLNQSGAKVAGLGASTKGNVVLQYCNFSSKDIFAIGEVNDDKFGKYTPGSLIPIISEQELLAQEPDYLLVLPWHFRNSIIKNLGKFIENGGKLIFPFPEIEVYG